MNSSKYKYVIVYVLYGYAHRHVPRSYVIPKGLVQTERVMCVVLGGAHRQVRHTQHRLTYPGQVAGTQSQWPAKHLVNP
jgi:hypothetical protein